MGVSDHAARHRSDLRCAVLDMQSGCPVMKKIIQIQTKFSNISGRHDTNFFSETKELDLALVGKVQRQILAPMREGERLKELHDDK